MTVFPFIKKIGYRALITLTIVLAGLCHSHAQARGKDTINYTSTCVNSTILFGSPLFDSIAFPSSIKWHFGDPASGFYDSSTSQQPRHVYSTTGTYYISLTVVGGNSDTTKMLDTLYITTPLAYDFGPDIYLCEGGDTMIKAPVIPGARYTWNDDSTTHDVLLHVDKSGVYTVSVNGCGVSDSIGVFVSKTPKIELGKDHIMCDSANLLLDAASQNGQYTWTLNNRPLPDNEGQLLTHYPGGTYIAEVRVPGCGIYRDTVMVTYSAPLAPDFSLGPDSLLCPKEVYTLKARLGGATAYDWSTGSAADQIDINASGTYWVFVTYNGTCQVTDTVLIKYRGDKPLDFRDTAICQGGTLLLNADFGNGQYDWTAIPAQRDDQNQTGQSTYYVYKPGTYAVSASVGHCVYKDTLKVSFDDSLKLHMITDTTLCSGEDFSLQVRGNADTYTWQDGSSSPSYRITQPGIYTVMTENGCGKDTLTATINMVACSCQLLLPNAFTPDGNGRNESFRPLHACEMNDYQMMIYDRYGELVFRSLDPEKGWDGRFHDHFVSPGAFVWMVHYFSTATKRSVFKKGSVLVIR